MLAVLVTIVCELVFLAVPEAALVFVVGGPFELDLMLLVLVATFIVLDVVPFLLLMDELLVSLSY